MELGKSAEALGGIRKLLQDVIAPELSGIKAQIGALHENVSLLREEMKAQESRLTRAVETAVKEAFLAMRLAESESRAANAERRMAEMALRLEGSVGDAPQAKQ